MASSSDVIFAHGFDAVTFPGLVGEIEKNGERLSKANHVQKVEEIHELDGTVFIKRRSYSSNKNIHALLC